MKYAKGGLIEGPSTVVRLERVGQCVHGMCLYSINGERPEHIARFADLQAGDTRALTCPCGKVDKA